MEERILTQHPEGKKGVNISRGKYDAIRNYILQTLSTGEPVAYRDLDKSANADLSESFDGKVSWYVVTVKLDLEARGEIERVPGTSPHQIRRVQP